MMNTVTDKGSFASYAYRQTGRVLETRALKNVYILHQSEDYSLLLLSINRVAHRDQTVLSIRTQKEWWCSADQATEVIEHGLADWQVGRELPGRDWYTGGRREERRVVPCDIGAPRTQES